MNLTLQQLMRPSKGNEKNILVLWGDGPLWEYSTAPLMQSDGKPVSRPYPGSGGHAMFFNDQQVIFSNKSPICFQTFSRRKKIFHVH